MNRIRRIGVLFWLLQVWPFAAAVLAAPAVSSFSPAQGRPGIQVTINGSGFSTASEVRFDNAIADFSATTDNRIIAVVPINATTGRIRITNPTGTGSSSANFVVAPRITDCFPTRSAPNTSVTLNGFNFVGTTNVSFNNLAASFAVTALTQIQVTVPPGATNGPITIRSPAGSATTTNDFVVTGPAPIIDNFSPGVGAPGTPVIIYGVNFTSVSEVRFNDVGATFSAPAPTQINTAVPASATTGRITVKTPGGTATNSNNFIVTRAPVVTNFFPARGKAGLTQVTIEGVNFSGVTGVGFNGRPVTGIGAPALNQLSVIVPVGATTGPISVTNGFGSGVSATNFVVTSAPIIDWFIPTIGAPGTMVWITGANLSNGATMLKFNGVTATFAVTGQGGTQIQTTVPAGATSGFISMSNSFGSFTTSSNFFVPGSAPFVTDFSPGFGPRGSKVTINGRNFFGPLSVKFNGVADTTTSGAASPTQFEVTVPAAATTGRITVTTTNGTSTNANIFYVPPRLISFTPTNGIVGDNIVLLGTNFTNATSVLFNNASAAFTINASNMITAVIPTNANTGPLTVITPGGVIIGTNNFRVLPQITSFVPTLGPTGTVVTVFGTSFINPTNVTFNGVNAAFTPVTIAEIRATVPPNGTTGPIRVFTPDGPAVSATNFIVTGSSDLSLTMTASAALLTPNQSLTYTIIVTNHGPQIVSGVTVTNVLSPGVAFVSAASTRGTCAHSADKVTCDIGALTNNTGLTITVVVTTIAEGDLTSSAVVTSVEPDLFLPNNSGAVTTTVLSDASRTLGIDRISGGSNVIVSWPVSPVNFTLQYLNLLSSSNLWLSVSNVPGVIGGRYTITNDASNGNQFYRLRKP